MHIDLNNFMDGEDWIKFFLILSSGKIKFDEQFWGKYQWNCGKVTRNYLEF